MKPLQLVKKGIQFLQDADIDLRTRMLLFLEYAAFVACILGTIIMLFFTTSIMMIIPNFILIFVCGLGIYLSRVKHKHDLAAIIIVGGCGYFALPYMYFTSGGYQSGMPVWLLFSIVFMCLMMKGKFRIIMPLIGIAIDAGCMIVGYTFPETVTSLVDARASFLDMLQSYFVVALIIIVCLNMYLMSYDNQKMVLEKKSEQLRLAVYTDSLTGIFNRHAYYDDVNKYTDTGYGKDVENLILVAMDINGLKKINDSHGHAAGDELIKSATQIMVDTYSKYGKIYRTGGDEFMAILFCSQSEFRAISEVMDEKQKSSNVAIAIGVAAWSENQDKNFFELEKMADSIMYQNKSNFYKTSGQDRRKR